MAVTKLWSVTERLGQVIDYATNPEKTSAKIKREFSPEQYQALADVIAYYPRDDGTLRRDFDMNQRDCKKCVYYGGKRKGKVFCLNDKCVRGKDRNRRKGNRYGSKN